MKRRTDEGRSDLHRKREERERRELMEAQQQRGEGSGGGARQWRPTDGLKALAESSGLQDGAAPIYGGWQGMGEPGSNPNAAAMGDLWGERPKSVS